MRLTNKVVAIVGGSSGIGLAGRFQAFLRRSIATSRRTASLRSQASDRYHAKNVLRFNQTKGKP
jgi:short-subunit dehydrogenase involved in D-alanine esterification of teichoic acids